MALERRFEASGISFGGVLLGVAASMVVLGVFYLCQLCARSVFKIGLRQRTPKGYGGVMAITEVQSHGTN